MSAVISSTLTDPRAVLTAAARVMERGSVGNTLAAWACLRGDHAALLDMDRQVTYSQLAAYVSSVAIDLTDAGIVQSDRVGVIVPEGMEGGQLIVAVACHCCMIPIGPALTPSEVLALIGRFTLDALVLPADAPEAVRSAVLGSGISVLAAMSPKEQADQCLQFLVRGTRTERDASAVRTDVALMLLSSGTTGRPKLVPVTHQNLLAMAGKMGAPEWFGLGPNDRAASILPLYYAAGLKNLLLVPLILGASVAFPPAAQALQMDQWLDRLRPTYFCATPAKLRGILDRVPKSAGSVAGSSLRFIMCGSAYLPEALRQDAQAVWGVPVVDCYGLSEGGLMAVNPVTPGRAKPGTVGLAAAGELFVVDEAGRELPRGQVGRIAVRGPAVSPGYLREDGTFTDSADAMMDTGDLGSLDAEGFLTIAGRAKEVINRGGEKVFPYEVEKALMAHPDVLEAAVFGVPHPRLGEGVAAAVVLKPGHAVAAAGLSSFLAEHLASFKIPRGIRIVDELPRNITGKIQRQQLVEAHLATRSADHELEPDSAMEREVLELWRSLLNRPDLGVDDDFFDKGGDSLLAVDMLTQVEQLTGISLEGFAPPVLTVAAIVDALADGLPLTPPVLMSPVRHGTGTPFFFCHGDFVAGGIFAHRLTRLLASDRPVYLLNCWKELGALSIEEMAEAYLPEVVRAAPSSPVFVGGYCNGGLVAWHLAHLLRERGFDVVEVLLIESLSLNGERGMRWLVSGVERLGSLLPRRLGRAAGGVAMHIVWALRRKGPAGFAAALYRRAIRPYGPEGARPPSTRELRDLQSRRGGVVGYRRMARYVPPRLDVPVTCFVADEGMQLDVAPVRWEGLAPRVRSVTSPGTHTSAVESHRHAMAARLDEVMAQAEVETRRRSA